MYKKFAMTGLILMGGVGGASPSVPPMRLTPTEIKNMKQADNNVGSGGTAGIHTNILFGDPTKAGFYALLLGFVPPHTIIQAHSHRDDRVVGSYGGWLFADTIPFDAKAETLPVGSVTQNAVRSLGKPKPEAVWWKFRDTARRTRNISIANEPSRRRRARRSKFYFFVKKTAPLESEGCGTRHKKTKQILRCFWRLQV